MAIVIQTGLESRKEVWLNKLDAIKFVYSDWLGVALETKALQKQLKITA